MWMSYVARCILSVLVEQNIEITVVKIKGNFDASLASLSRPLFETLVQHADKDMTLDLSEVSAIDSSGLGVIVYLFKRLICLGLKLSLMGLHGQPMQFINELLINQVIDCHGLSASA